MRARVSFLFVFCLLREGMAPLPLLLFKEILTSYVSTGNGVGRGTYVVVWCCGLGYLACVLLYWKHGFHFLV